MQFMSWLMVGCSGADYALRLLRREPCCRHHWWVIKRACHPVRSFLVDSQYSARRQFDTRLLSLPGCNAGEVDFVEIDGETGPTYRSASHFTVQVDGCILC